MSGEVPEGWREAPFSALARFENGRAFKPTDWGDHGLPIVRIAQITNPQSETNRYSGDVDSRHLLDDGDLIFSWSATLAVMRWEGGPAVLNQHLFKVTPAEGINQDWLQFRLEASISDLAEEAHGTTMKHIRKGTLSSQTTLVPPQDEQRRIAEVLRSVDDTISLVGRQSEQGFRALSAYATEAFAEAVPEDGEGIALEALLTHIIDYRGVPPPKATSGVPLLTAKNVRVGFLDPEPREFIAEADYASWMRRGIPAAGDVMFTTEAPLGNVAEFPDYRAALGQRTLTLRADPRLLNPSYLKWLLLSPSAQALIGRHATGSTAKGIKQRTFRKLRFNVPALEAQNEIGMICEGIWTVILASREQSRAMAILRGLLADDLLSGRVRVPA